MGYRVHRLCSLWHMGSLVELSSCGVWALLPRGMWDLSSLTRDQTHVPWTGRQIFYHWTTREVPLIVILIHISVMTYDVEHLFIFFSAICIFSLVRCLFRSFAHLWIWLFSYFLLWVLRVLCIFWIPVLYWICGLQFIFTSHGFSFHSFNSVFHRMEVFNFNEVRLVNFFFHELCFLCCI